MSSHYNGTLRVLAIPELLDMIFRFLDNGSNASNARVCKRWSDIALDVLWQDVKDLPRLLSILAPLPRDGNDGSLKFLRPLQPSDWKTFERYRRRVRSLAYRVHDAEFIHRTVFDEVARSRTSLDLLPNMQALEWHAALEPCVIFMHKNIKTFAITLPDPDEYPTLGAFLQDISERMPNLTHLDLRLTYAISTVEHDIIQLLPNLRNLRKFTLPRLCFTSNIAEAASRNGVLEIIDFQYFDYQGAGDSDDVANFNPSLQEGAYPSLHELSVSLSFRDTTAFVLKPFSPTNLKELFIDSPVIESPANFSKLVSTVADNCQLLKSFSLMSSTVSEKAIDMPYDKDDCITMDHLRPLFKCPNLVYLDITHPYPLQLQLHDIEEIALSWPSVEELILNNEPYYMKYSDLTLTALLPFARHCPKLKTLGLFLNATTKDIEPISSQNIAYPVFRSLTKLSMGISMIPDEGATALFLSQICPLGCTIDSGVTWFHLDDGLDTWMTIRGRSDGWVKVRELLPLLTKLRVEERKQAKLLEQEVDELRQEVQEFKTRANVLLDRVSVAAGYDQCIAI